MSMPGEYRFKQPGDLIYAGLYSDMIWEVRKVNSEHRAYDCVFWGSSAPAENVEFLRKMFKEGDGLWGLDPGDVRVTPPSGLDARIPWHTEKTPNEMLVIAIAAK